MPKNLLCSKFVTFCRLCEGKSLAGPYVSIPALKAQTWLAGVVILLSFTNALAESEFSTFWQKFKSAIIAGDKAAVAEITNFPLSMPYGIKTVKNKQDFLRRYDEMFKGEANAAQCFAKSEPRKESAKRYEIYCAFKATPNYWKTRLFVSCSN